MRKRLLVVLFAVGVGLQAGAYHQVPVVTAADAVLQRDSLGFNLVRQLSHWLQKEVETGNIALYAAADRRTQRSAAEVKKKAKAAGISISQANVLFLYERWTSGKQGTSFEIEGILFNYMREDQPGQPVELGFVAFTEEIKAKLRRTVVPVNAAAPYGITLYQGLMNRYFNYSVIAFGTESLAQKEKVGERLKRQAFQKRENLNYEKVDQQKMLRYLLQPDYSRKDDPYRKLRTYLAAFFNDNPQEVLNAGGDQYFQIHRRTPIHISGIEIVSVWQHTGGTIVQKPMFVVVYVLGLPLHPIPVNRFNDWGFVVGSQTIEEFVKTQKMQYVLLTVNSETVDEKRQAQVQHALERGSWHKLTILFRKKP